MSERIPFYRVVRGNGFWEPTARMKLLGFSAVPCGPDGDEARQIASVWNERWQASRQQIKRTGSGLSASSKSGYVYFLRLPTRVKIGFSTNPFTRTGQMKTGLPDQVLSMVAVRGTKAEERKVHLRLAPFRQSGEWFVAAAVVLQEMSRAAVYGSVDPREGTSSTERAEQKAA